MGSRIARHCVVAVVAGGFLLASSERIWAGPAAATSAASDEAEANLKAKLDRNLPTLRFHNNGFSDVVDFLQDMTSANIYVDWRSLAAAGITPDSPVTYSAHDVAFKDSINAILRGFAATKPVGFHLVNNIIVISSDGGMAAFRKAREALPKEISDAKLKAKFEKPLPELRFHNNSLSDVIDFLRDVTGANIFVDWPALKEAGISKDAPVSLRLRDISLRDGLNLIFDQASTDKARVVYSTEGEIITISPAATKLTP